jgi:hypothetical protein
MKTPSSKPAQQQKLLSYVLIGAGVLLILFGLQRFFALGGSSVRVRGARHNQKRSALTPPT